MMTALGAAGVVSAFALSSLYFSPLAVRLVYNRSLRRYLSRNRILALTYDDGPSSFTPQILDVLRLHGAAGTFFMLGAKARFYRDVVDKVAREGHAIGCHSSQHLNAWKVAPWRARQDIETGYSELSNWVPSDGMFRPPFGKMTLPSYLAVHRRGARPWWWTIDSGDAHLDLPDPEGVARALLRDGGGVVLMHDLDRSSARNEFVLQTTALLLEVARNNSLEVKRLSDL